MRLRVPAFAHPARTRNLVHYQETTDASVMEVPLADSPMALTLDCYVLMSAGNGSG